MRSVLQDGRADVGAEDGPLIVVTSRRHKCGGLVANRRAQARTPELDSDEYERRNRAMVEEWRDRRWHMTAGGVVLLATLTLTHLQNKTSGKMQSGIDETKDFIMQQGRPVE